MKWVIIVFIALIFLTACSKEKAVEKIQNEVLNMKLASNDFKQGDMIPRDFTCQGKNINPQLEWSDVPGGAKSFALILDDPDAPGGLFVHWAVKDIPSSIREIKQNSVSGTQLPNDYRVLQYKGPCPPALHRYFFRLYALNIEKLSAENYDELYKEVKQHTIAKAELMGTYQKS